MIQSMNEILDKIDDFLEKRNWKPKHEPKSLSMSIAIEAGELMEVFQWCGDAESQELIGQKETVGQLRDELADVAIYTIELANTLGLDAGEIVKKVAQLQPFADTPKNLVILTALRAAEILAVFRFCSNEDSKTCGLTNAIELENKITDIFMYLRELAHLSDTDLGETIGEKMARNEKRFPVKK